MCRLRQVEMDDAVPRLRKHMQDLPKDSVRCLWKEEKDDPVPTWCKHMQDLPKDSVHRLWKKKKRRPSSEVVQALAGPA